MSSRAGESGRVAKRLSLGKAIVIAGLVEAIAAFALPVSAGMPNPMPVLVVAAIPRGGAYSVLSINQINLRQRITPTRLLGRVTAARRFLIFCMAPGGAILGGWIGTQAGLEAALAVGACLILAGATIMYFSPIRDAT